MIDCLLVLLIFFMSITSAEVLQVDKDIKLPVAPDAAKKEKNQGPEGALNVRWNAQTQKGIFTVDNKVYEDVEELVEVLKARKENNANHPQGYRIIIRGDQNLPAVEIQRAMSVLGQAGLDNIAFSAMNN